MLEVHKYCWRRLLYLDIIQDRVKLVTVSLVLTLFIFLNENYSCVQGHPPAHQRFKDKRIPAHVTFAYKKNVTIMKNDDFYQLARNEIRTIDLLFLMSNAPVATGSFPEAGSEPYVGLSTAMELAVAELSNIFPEILRPETKSSNRCESDKC